MFNSWPLFPHTKFVLPAACLQTAVTSLTFQPCYSPVYSVRCADAYASKLACFAISLLCCHIFSNVLLGSACASWQSDNTTLDLEENLFVMFFLGIFGGNGNMESGFELICRCFVWRFFCSVSPPCLLSFFCTCSIPSLTCHEVTLCGWWDAKIQELTDPQWWILHALSLFPVLSLLSPLSAFYSVSQWDTVLKTYLEVCVDEVVAESSVT